MENKPEMNGAPERPPMPDPKVMKKVGLQMSLLMGITLSLCLSLVGLIQAGQFSVPSLLMNFAVSFVISMVIGLLVPMKKVGESVVRSAKLRPGSIGARLLESLISDLIYTPIITIAMVTLAYFMATSHGAQLNYVPMLLGSLLTSMVVGYVLIFIFMPLFMKLVMKKNGIAPPK